MCTIAVLSALREKTTLCEGCVSSCRVVTVALFRRSSVAPLGFRPPTTPQAHVDLVAAAAARAVAKSLAAMAAKSAEAAQPPARRVSARLTALSSSAASRR